MRSGIVFHFDPDLVAQPSAFAISMDTGGPSRKGTALWERAAGRVTSLPSRLANSLALAFSMVQAMQLFWSPSPSTWKRIGRKRPQVFTAAIRNCEEKEGFPWMIARFWMMANGLAFMRAAISKAITQSGKLPWKAVGTS